jgi:hypothetical protein
MRHFRGAASVDDYAWRYGRRVSSVWMLETCPSNGCGEVLGVCGSGVCRVAASSFWGSPRWWWAFGLQILGSQVISYPPAEVTHSLSSRLVGCSRGWVSVFSLTRRGKQHN